MRWGVLIAVLFLALLAAVVVVVELVRIPGMYQVQGSGTTKYRPDVATLSVGAYFEADASADAIGQTATVVHNVLDALKAAGIADSDIESKSVSSGPKSDRNSTEQSKTPAGYYAEQIVAVTVHDISRLSKLLDVVSAAGSNNWQVTYFASDPAKIMAKAREAAFADALARADALAKSGGFQRGPVLKIMDDRTQWPEPDYYRRDYTNTASVERVTVTGSRAPARRNFSVPPPQEETFSVEVGVLFEIK